MVMNMQNTPSPSRRELRRQDRREAILAVAAQTFLEQGYAGTTMSGIAATLGGSKGTLWSYFASKEELFAAVIDQVTSAYRTRLTEILDEPSDDMAATLKRFCTSIMEKVTRADSIALHRLVLAEAGRFPEMGQIFYQRAPRLTHTMLSTFLLRAMEKGQLRQEEPIQVARLLVSLCLSGCHQKLLMGLIETASADMIAEDVERATNVFMRAYALQPDPQ